jgi:hypothetical protein
VDETKANFIKSKIAAERFSELVKKIPGALLNLRLLWPATE